MPFNPDKYESLVKGAVAHYWKTLDLQSKKQITRSADRGRRSGVTGGKQMHGFCQLVSKVLYDSGLTDAEIFFDRRLDIPGFFRPTKNWDMLVVSKNQLVAAMEFKSQCGPSFGNNFNNRSEEAIGTGKDISVAIREGAFGKKAPLPWLGWVMLLEDHPKSTVPVGVKESHFKVFPEFKDSSYAKRYELLLQRLVQEKLFDGAALLLSTEKGGRRGQYSEPAGNLSMAAFLAGLAGHVGVHLASRGKKR